MGRTPPPPHTHTHTLGPQKIGALSKPNSTQVRFDSSQSLGSTQTRDSAPADTGEHNTDFAASRTIISSAFSLHISSGNQATSGCNVIV